MEIALLASPSEPSQSPAAEPEGLLDKSRDWNPVGRRFWEGQECQLIRFFLRFFFFPVLQNCLACDLAALGLDSGGRQRKVKGSQAPRVPVARARG